jgi:alkaline phosphatase/streptomycin-6-phosphatase
MIGSKERIAALVVVGITAVGAVGASLATAGGGSRTDQIRHQLKSGNHVRNVIFFLGDGMGTQEITARRHATPRGL